jgi:hypothetical protein
LCALSAPLWTPQAAITEAPVQKEVSAQLVYFDNTAPPCGWGIGVVYGNEPGASSYTVSYWDGYYKQVVTSSVPARQAAPLPKGKPFVGPHRAFVPSPSDHLLGITGGNGSGPDCNYSNDPTEGGRFSKGAKAWAVFPLTNEKFTISGIVIDERTSEHKRLQGVGIKLSGPKGGEEVTGADGTYSFDALPEGSYELSVESANVCADVPAPRPGPGSQKTCEKRVPITLTSSVRQDFRLIPATLEVLAQVLRTPVTSGLSYEEGKVAFATSDLTGFECRSGCMSLRIQVLSLTSGEPVSDAEVTISAPPITGSQVVTPDQGAGYFCAPIVDSESNCGNPLRVKTDSKGQIPSSTPQHEIVYWLPGIVDSNPSTPTAYPLRITVEASKDGWQRNASALYPTLLPNTAGAGGGSTLGRHTVVLSADDASFLNFWATVDNAPSYISAVKRTVASDCDRVKKFTGYNLVMTMTHASDEDVEFALGKQKLEVKQTFDQICSIPAYGSSFFNFLNQGAKLFELDWALRAFHIKGLGLVAGWSPRLFSTDPTSLIPSLHSGFADAVTEAVRQLFTASDDNILPGDRFYLDVYEVSTVPDVSVHRPPEIPPEPSLLAPLKSALHALSEPFRNFQADFTERFTPAVYIRFTALPVRLEPVASVVSDGYEPAFWLNPTITG